MARGSVRDKRFAEATEMPEAPATPNPESGTS